MKSLTAVVVALAVLAVAAGKSLSSKTADEEFLRKQKFIFEMLQHVYQDDVWVNKYDDSFYKYVPWQHVDRYDHADKLEHFFELWQQRPFLDDQVFTVVSEHCEEYAHGLVSLFYFAKDWDTFAHTVFWARTHVNKQLFVYSLNVAVLFQPQLEGIVLPAIYEVFPWYFFDADTISAAEKFRMNGFHNVKKLDNIYNVVIKSNYTNVYGDVNFDHNLAYFLEDVGLNSFYYYFNLDYPYWTKGVPGRELNKDRRGELWLYTHWQLLARYYLERLSHDIGEVEHFDMYAPVRSGYYSGLQYYFGVSFPTRDNHYSFYEQSVDNFDHIKHIQFYSQRIVDFIHKNEKHDTETVNVLGNIIQGNVDSINEQYYGSLDRYYRYLVNEGRPYGKYHKTLPSTFMHYETSVRDPLFYQIYNEMLWYYWELMETYPEYTTTDFVFDGVKIDAVHVPESLTTYFEYFDADISNAVNVEVPEADNVDTLVAFGRNSHYEGHSYAIKARQYRLNHKPFEFTLDVSAEESQKAVVKIFIGPKYDEMGKLLYLEDSYKNFFELDHFAVELVAGVNHIKRNSNDFSFWVNDRTTYLELYQKVMHAFNIDYKFQLNQMEAHCGVPNRLMLPRGKKGGQPFQFFFMVYPYHAPAVEQGTGYDHVVSCGIGSGSRYVDALPFGFPFNRPVQHSYYFDVPNFHFHDVKIYHKEDTTNTV